ncbi:hypothetical protein DENSPDRAFT_836973 [Dentipellis sp. KUC8613]|nr:hypothetical protein DENSPDRAFT_836973 [Dentipellis sp. KUC8613]
MARTTAKPKKTTSGVAPRKRLGEWTEDSAGLAKKVKPVCLDDGEVATDNSGPPAPKDDPDADYCNRCDDGGVTLIECDRCKRVHCRDCVKFDLSDERLATVYYFCFQCHIEEERGRQPKPYVGLYEREVDAHGQTIRGKPLQSTSARLMGQPALIASQRVVTAPLVIVHLHLSTCFTTSTDFISSIITPYFKHDKLKRRIVVRDINFNLGNSTGRKAYAGCIKGLVKALKNMEAYPQAKTRALVMVSTHSDENRGDLFREPAGSLCHADFFASVFPPTLLDALATFDTTHLFMVCGAFVSIPQSLSELKRMIHQYNFANVLTFTAPRLQPDHVKPFLLQLMQKHFIHGYPLANVLPSILSEIPPKFGRHTGIIHLQYGGPNLPCVAEPGNELPRLAGSIADQDPSREPWELSVLATKYQWHSGSIQPWGVYIPDQCPACLCLRQWDFGKPNLNAIQPITIVCRGRKEQRAAESSPEVDAVQPQDAGIKMSKHRDRGRAKREAREKLQHRATDADERVPENSNLVPCTNVIVCEPPAAGFKWVKPVSDHVQGKWMMMDA